MITKVYEILEGLALPLDYNFRQDFDSTGMTISYHFFNEGALQFGDGEELLTGGALQIDLFVKHGIDFTHKNKEILKLMKENGFKREEVRTEYENVDGVGNIDHIIFVFNYIEQE